MLTIKDFKKGDKAYSLLRNNGRNTEPVIAEVEVISVGRSYVTTGGVWQKKYQNWDEEYLFEKNDFGESDLLFKTREDAENYIEKCNLTMWLGCLSVAKAESYTLEQLRRVKEILS